MKVKLNGQTVNLPSAISEITPEQRIAFAQQYGKEFITRFRRIDELTNENDQAAAHCDWWFDKMYAEIAFFSGMPEEELRQSHLDDEVIQVYMKTLYGLIPSEILNLSDVHSKTLAELVDDTEALVTQFNTPAMQAAQAKMNVTAEKINREFMAPYYGVMGAINKISSINKK